jgi:hypothetical protein
MSLVGKILLFVNLLAAAALVYFTSQDYARRRELNATALQYHLLLNGLPIDEPPADAGDDIPIDASVVPGHRAETMSKTLLDKYMAAAGGSVKSQVEEVKKAKQNMEAAVANLPGPLDKIRFLCGAVQNNKFSPGLLMRFADTYEERAAIRELAAVTDPAKFQAAYEDAAARLSRKFDALITAPNPAAAQADATKLADLQAKVAGNDPQAKAEMAALEGAGSPPYTRDALDRQLRIAKTLMLVATTPDAQKRVMYLCGLKTYARAIADQTTRVEEIARRTERQLELDQQTFQDEYETLKRLAQEQDQLLYQQQRVVAGLKAQAEKDDEAVNVRNSQLAALKTDLTKVTEQVTALLAAQAKVEAELLAVQQKVGDTLVGNLTLEDRLLKAEQGKK